jgi:hypothetical protein
MYFFCDEFAELVPYIEKAKENNHDTRSTISLLQYYQDNGERYVEINKTKCYAVRDILRDYLEAGSFMDESVDKDALLDELIKVIYTKY